MRNRIRKNKAGSIAWLLQLLCSVVLAVLIIVSRLLPGLYTCLICLGLAVLLAAAALGIFMPRERLLRLIISVISVMVSVLLIIGCFYVKKTSDALSDISGNDKDAARISVYVFEDDKAETIEDARDYEFGILASLDRDNTDKALDMIKDDVGKQVKTSEYDSVTELADNMMDGNVRAIVLNEEYMKMLEGWDDEEEAGTDAGEETENRDYPGFASSLRVLATYTVENVREGEYKADNGQFIMYISGIDTWGGISTRSRSDVNILAAVNTETKEILLVSTPRDYYVPLSISNGVNDKLTHAGIYGVQCSMDTLSMLYGIDIDYYFRVNFSGFEKIIDELGGITVWSDYTFDVPPNFHYEQGNNELNGLEALAFARERYTLPGGDNARGQNQMNVIISVADKLSSAAVLGNYMDILDSLEGTFETDMPYSVIASLVRQQLADGSEWDISAFAVTGTGTHGSTYSMGSRQLYVMVPDQESVNKASQLMDMVMNGEKLTEDDLTGGYEVGDAQ